MYAIYLLTALLSTGHQSVRSDPPTPVERHWRVDGVDRLALVSSPLVPVIADQKSSAKLPVIFAFHGHGGTMRNAALKFGYHRLWPEAIVVYMQGLPTPGVLTDPEGKRNGWQKAAGDQNDRDLKFFDVVLETLKKEYRVDEKRIFAAGHSNGGAFTYLLWAERGNTFAAVAPSAAAAARSLPNLKPKPALHVAGESDQLVRFTMQERTMNAVRKLNGCSDSGKPWDKSGSLTGTLYPSATGTPFVSVVYSGSHALPDEAPALIVKFFKEIGEKSVDRPTLAKVTYHNQISRILQSRCESCHYAGGVAPFDLSTYAAVRSRAKTIRTVIEKKTMPPWFAAPEEKSQWRNDCSLSDSDRNAITSWVAQGTPEGDPKEAPAPITRVAGWQIGKPDAVFQLPHPIAVSADGVMPYQIAVAQVGYPEDRWVQAMEIKPSAKQVVHHVLVFVAPKRDVNSPSNSFLEQAEGLAGYFAIYVPGNSALIYPDGFAKRLPAGADLRFQIHYTPNGKAVEDRCSIGLIFAKKPPEHEVKTTGIVNLAISIPPGEENHKEFAQLRVPADVRILSYLPHMHLRGKACRYELVSEDGKRETLLDIPRYDFNWQLEYDYREPKAIGKGSLVEFTAWFDNSTKNPANPDPTRTVRWGPQTFEEMHLGYVEYYVPGAKPGDSTVELRPSFLSGLAQGRTARGGFGGGPLIIQMFKRLDKDGDGFVTESEAGLLWARIKQADTNGDGKVSLEEAKKAFGGGLN